MKLHNTINGEKLKKKIKSSKESRTTISFYKYAKIANPHLFRDHLFYHWDNLRVLGRIYVAKEGINAQLSIPKDIRCIQVGHIREAKQALSQLAESVSTV